MKDALITTCSVLAVIALSVGIGELALIRHQPGYAAAAQLPGSR